ncbi:O-antigen ligase family protein [Endozoicomonadaceae bacterium StTr2]
MLNSTHKKQRHIHSLIVELDLFLRKKAIPFGMLIQLTGILWLGDNGGYITQTYIWCLLPSLVCGLISLYRYRFIGCIYQMNTIHKLYLLILAWILLNTIISPEGEISQQKTLARILYIATYFYAAHIIAFNLKNPEKIIISCCFIAGIFSLASIIWQYGFNGLTPSFRAFDILGSRIYSLGYKDFADFGNPTIAALYYGTFLAALIGCFFHPDSNENKKKIYLLLCIPLISFIILSGSRGALYSIVLTIVIASIQNHKKIKHYFIFLISFLIPIILFRDQLHTIVSNLFSGNSTVLLRFTMWEESMKLISQNPIFGVGGFTKVNLYTERMIYDHPHNMYIKVALHWGIPAAALFIASLAAGIYTTCKEQSSISKITFYIFIFGSLGMMSDTYSFLSRPGVQWLLLFLPLGLSAGILSKKTNKEKTKDQNSIDTT